MEPNSDATHREEVPPSGELCHRESTIEARPRVVLHIRLHLKPGEVLPIETIPRRCERNETMTSRGQDQCE